MSEYEGRWTTVRVEVEEGIGWVILNRPEKRNAMSPTLNREMRDVLETLEARRSGQGARADRSRRVMDRRNGPEGIFPRSRSGS